MSKVISKLRSLWSELSSSKEARDEYVAARIATDLSHQIYSLREERGWTQGELAERAGHANSQGWISRLENYCEPITVKTLKQIASAFDVGLSIKFVPFNQLAHETVSERLDRYIPSFDRDCVENGSPVFNLHLVEVPSRRVMKPLTVTSPEEME